MMQVQEKPERKRYLEFITSADGLDGYNSHCDNKIGTRHFPEICHPDLHNMDKDMILAR